MSDFESAVSRFGNRNGKPIAAPATVTLGPEDFASDWSNRPVSPIQFGLRLPSEDDVQTARLEADRRVAAAGPGAGIAVDSWNDALMACAVARCLCNPSNVSQAHPVIPFAEDTISAALTSAGIRKVFDAIERLMVEQSALATEATDEDLVALSALIVTGRHHDLEGAPAAKFRRFASYMLEAFED